MPEKSNLFEGEDWKNWFTEMPKSEQKPDDTANNELQHFELDHELLPAVQMKKSHFGINVSEMIDQPVVVSTSFGSLTGTLIGAEEDYLVLVESTATKVLIPYRGIQYICTI